MVGQNCPQRGSRIQCRIRVRALIEIFLGECIFTGGIETRETAGGRQLVLASTSSGNYRYADCFKRRLTSPMCLPSLCFLLQRQKFSIIWPGIQMRKTPSTASFTGGYSTPASKNGRRELQRPSRNSSNKVFSNKSDPRTGTSFTTSHRIISRRFSNRRHETLTPNATP